MKDFLEIKIEDGVFSRRWFGQRKGRLKILRREIQKFVFHKNLRDNSKENKAGRTVMRHKCACVFICVYMKRVCVRVHVYACVHVCVCVCARVSPDYYQIENDSFSM